MELGEHAPTDLPVQDCDCNRCAVHERNRLRKLLDEVQESLERDVAAMPMFPITAENAEAAQDAMTGVCFTLGVLRVRDHELVRAGEQGANA